ncbi:hypothetical protein D3C81_2012590 [compost metagenome]
MAPPSPSLSARSTDSMYLIETTQTSDQKISESTPRTPSWLTWTPYCSEKTSFRVYSGLVPISP